MDIKSPFGAQDTELEYDYYILFYFNLPFDATMR